MKHQPLRIEFEMKNPVTAPEHPIHFDGVLAWACVQDTLDQGVPFDVAQANLPLAKEERDGCSVWKASWIEFEPGPRDVLSLTRPFRVHDVVADMGEVFTELRRQKWTEEGKSGPNKAYLIMAPLRHSKRANAWCVGDAEAIDRLLRTHVTHLGKLARLGVGRIKAFTIHVDERAEQAWQWRSMPWPVEGYAKAMETTRPPYWKREHRGDAWVPLKSTRFMAPFRPERA